jgi:hypothetical protein
MRRLTVEQFARMINRMVEENGLYWVAGTIRESRDLWRCPANMKLLSEEARIAAHHYLSEGK